MVEVSVFPAYAGMFLPSRTIDDVQEGFPRIRGDVPGNRDYRGEIRWFSPHTRGCSELSNRCGHGRLVFPAYAGMFRTGRKSGGISISFPRIRGDVPPQHCLLRWIGRFSPHTRGCSDPYQSHPGPTCVFPAYAGMFLGLSGVVAAR